MKDVRQRPAAAGRSLGTASGVVDEENGYRKGWSAASADQAQHRNGPDRCKAAAAGRGKPGLAVVVSLYIIVTPLLREAGLAPLWVTKAAIVIGMAALAAKLLRFQRWGDEIPHARPFFVAFALLILELSIENFFIWAVAASDQRKYENQQPLQDNVEVLWAAVLRRMPAASVLFRRPWVEILQQLVALIMLGTSVLFDQVPFSGFGMCTRAIYTIIITRIIRTGAFMLTILPSQRPGCFARRFPPVPDSLPEYLWIGFTKLRAMGGCNDLVISGHAIIYCVSPLAFRAYYPGWTGWLLWLGVLHSSIRAPLTRQHYSVDMYLAAVVTALVWHWCTWAYDAKPWRQRQPGEPPDQRQRKLTALILLVLSIVAYIIIAGGA